TIRELAGKLLNVKEINEEINNIKEASRFLEESRFLRKLSRLETALERAEIAIAPECFLPR
ncbi:MAG: hypothetical protein LBI18_15365, partial [Planctomycetaceae bacterium]|nr:hypothetical protein [Planctomycetaceae bacterium]